MSDGMGREFMYLSSHATNRYLIPNWGKRLQTIIIDEVRSTPFIFSCKRLDVTLERTIAMILEECDKAILFSNV